MSCEKFVVELLSQRLGVNFGAAKRPLGSWGQADRCVELRRNSWLLLEVEGKQHHPNTNVLKLWPFLEEHHLRWGDALLVHRPNT